MEILNLVPHKLKIHYNRYKNIIIPQGETVARAIFESEYLTTVNNIPVHTRRVRKLQGLPKLRKDVVYIVSSIFQQSIDEDMADTYNFYSPDTISDAWISNGNVLEVAKLAKV